MIEVTTLPWPYKGLRSRRPGKDEPSAPKEEARTPRAPTWPLGAAVTFSLGSEETRTLLVAPAAAPSSAQPPRALPPALQPRPGTEDVASIELWRRPSHALQAAASSRAPAWRAPPRARPSVPRARRARTVTARAPCQPARRGRRRWGGRARLSAAGFPALAAHCPQARDAAAQAEIQSRGWGHPGLRPLLGVPASPGAMRACAGCPLPGRCPRARPGRRAPAPDPAAARGVPRR